MTLWLRFHDSLMTVEIHSDNLWAGKGRDRRQVEQEARPRHFGNRRPAANCGRWYWAALDRQYECLAAAGVGHVVGALLGAIV
jgi:hypothetical protein